QPCPAGQFCNAFRPKQRNRITAQHVLDALGNRWIVGIRFLNGLELAQGFSSDRAKVVPGARSESPQCRNHNENDEQSPPAWGRRPPTDRRRGVIGRKLLCPAHATNRQSCSDARNASATGTLVLSWMIGLPSCCARRVMRAWRSCQVRCQAGRSRSPSTVTERPGKPTVYRPLGRPCSSRSSVTHNSLDSLCAAIPDHSVSHSASRSAKS